MNEWLERKYKNSRILQYVTKTSLIVSVPFILSLCIALVDWGKLSTLSFAKGEWAIIVSTFFFLLLASIIQYKVFVLDYKISKKSEDIIHELERQNKEYIKTKDECEKEKNLWVRILVHINRILSRKSARIIAAIKSKKVGDVINLLDPNLQIQENISQIKQFFDGLRTDERQKFRVTLMTPVKEDSLEYLEISYWHNEDLKEPRSKINHELAKSFQKGRTVAGYCWAKGDIVIVGNCTEELKKGRNSIFEIIHEGHFDIQSMFSYPIFDRELYEPDLLAVLNVDTNIPGFFKEIESEKIKTIMEPFINRLIYEARIIYYNRLKKNDTVSGDSYK